MATEETEGDLQQGSATIDDLEVHPLRVRGELLHRGRAVAITNYCYIVSSRASNEAALVDPAWDAGAIEARLCALGKKLTAVFLTHSHYDHVNLAARFARQHGTPVFMSRVEAEYYAFDCFGLQVLEDKAPVALGAVRGCMHLTAGHTQGSSCYRFGRNLFSGDTLFAEGCGICVGRGANPRAMFASLSFLKTQLPTDTRVYPGHSFGISPGATLGSLFETNVYLNLNDEEKFVAFRMRAEQTRVLSFT